jgi:hypothetical protein
MIQTIDYSINVGTSPVQVLPFLGKENLQYMRLWNVAAQGGPTIWLSRSGVAGVNVAGSFPLAPGEFEKWVDPQPIPVNALSAVSTAADSPLTIEIG